ncbi:MAG: Protein YzbB, partial [uncultured Gemmatimonadetes bacterium]
MKPFLMIPLAALPVAAVLALGGSQPKLAAPVQTGPPAAHAAEGPAQEVIPGLEILLRDSLHLVRGKRVGLITNHTAVTRDGRHAADVLHRAPGVRRPALCAPEQGLRS